MSHFSHLYPNTLFLKLSKQQKLSYFLYRSEHFKHCSGLLISERSPTAALRDFVKNLHVSLNLI